MQNFVLRYSVVRCSYLLIIKPLGWFEKLLLSPPEGLRSENKWILKNLNNS